MPSRVGPKNAAIDRRQFLTGSAAVGAALGVTTAASAAETATGSPRAQASVSALPAPNFADETRALEQDTARVIARPGADFMVDVLKTLDIEYVAANPGSTFRGLQESLINYGRNSKPEWLTCCHEESSVGIAHGYAKIAGKPMVAMLHSTVGVQHASMAIYNAYADRVPIVLISGNALDANTRRVPVEWYHSVQDNAAMVRDYTKWDDTPVSLQHYAESQVRAYKLATAVPMAPVLISVDMDLQENELEPAHEALLQIPRMAPDLPPAGDSVAVQQLADWLINAQRPVIVADRYARTASGMQLLVTLAELLQAPVMDTGTRMNFPNAHPLCHSGRADLIRQADVILALEPEDLWGMTHELRDVSGKPWESITAPEVKLASIGTGDLLIKANYQDFQRYSAADLAITGDPEATLPALIEAIRRTLPRSAGTRLAQRGQQLRQEHQRARERQLALAAVGWNDSPISSPRVVMELWDLIRHDDWSVVGWPTSSTNLWARRLWTMDKPYSHTGESGAAGVGYGAPAAVGAALANRDRGRLSINFQPDGDLMYAPGVLWTAVHHRIPLLNVMFNNRGYHQELMHLQRMTNRHNRGAERTVIGTTLRDPDIDYAKMAQSMGMYAEGPISDPSLLREALVRCLEVVRRGQPALIDVVSQPR